MTVSVYSNRELTNERVTGRRKNMYATSFDKLQNFGRKRNGSLLVVVYSSTVIELK